jgi:hypothetical protein
MFISYGALILFYISLQMIKKSVSWAFVYEILHYLKHGTDPLVLHEQMQLVIPKILAFKWSVVGGRKKSKEPVQLTTAGAHRTRETWSQRIPERSGKSPPSSLSSQGRQSTFQFGQSGWHLIL